MQIKRTIKDGYAETGQTETIGEERMRNIIAQTQLAELPSRDKDMGRTDEAMQRLKESGRVETFYAKYELIEA